MKVFFKNANLIFQRCRRTLTVYGSSFAEEDLITGICSGKDGSIKQTDSSAYSTIANLYNIPSFASIVSSFDCGYSMVDGFAIFQIFDEEENWLVSGSDDNPIKLTDYPSAKKIRFSFNKNSSGKIVFSE